MYAFHIRLVHTCMHNMCTKASTHHLLGIEVTELCALKPDHRLLTGLMGRLGALLLD